jgi:hypothetical protein
VSQCAQCGADFDCGIADAPAQQPCWCAQLPTLAGVPLAGSCLCPTCLQERIRSTAQGQDAPGAL